MKKNKYEHQLKKLQIELVKMQEWTRETGQRVVIVFEGRDAAGKGGTIKAITAKLNPRVVQIVALAKPTERERSQWYFQRYAENLPAAGEIMLFDRSWYNRAGVEKVMGFCTDDEYRDFLQACPAFEEMLIKSGITLIKYWFSVSDIEQEKRFNGRLTNPLKRWKFSPMDLVSREKWREYSEAKDKMFAHTDTKTSPWYVVEADDKRSARLNCIAHLLSQVDYSHTKREIPTLPPINKEKHYRPPLKSQNHVPKKYGK
jgi:polyphosphate kinase 2